MSNASSGLLRPLLLSLFVLSLFHISGLGTGCRVIPPATDASPPDDQSPDLTTVERSTPPEPRVQDTAPLPDPPAPRDEGPVVPEKVLINGLDVIVTHVTDGDTVYVVKKPGGWASRVRLKGINAPECKKKTASDGFQECSSDDDYYGLESFNIAKALAKGEFRKVKISCLEKDGECEKDTFGRYLAYLELPDGRDLAQEVIKAGGGWAFTAFTAEKMADFCRAEAAAIKARKGMWSKGRSYVKSTMSNDNLSWYYNRKTSSSHDGICDKALGESFAQLAGE